MINKYISSGEHGVTLSGGQKARIALARAVMQNKEVILLDDPLSAVDAQVANHIFDQCILRRLHGKTRIFVTHHVDFLRSADQVIVMKDGKIIESGPPERLLPKLPMLGEVIVAENAPGESADESDEPDEGEGGKVRELLPPIVEEPTALERARSKKKRGKRTQLIQEEQRERGSVKLFVYKQYWKAVGNFWSIAVFLSLFAMQGTISFFSYPFYLFILQKWMHNPNQKILLFIHHSSQRIVRLID